MQYSSHRYEDKEYALVKHLDPVFVIARQTKSGYYLLGDAEAEAVRKSEIYVFPVVFVNCYGYVFLFPFASRVVY